MNTVSGSHDVPIDTVAPTISFVPATIATQRAGFDLGINFSEDVTGFTVSDLTRTGPATLGTTWRPGEAGPQRYDVSLTPDSAANGVVTVTVAAEAAQDAAGNKNAAAQWSVTFDLVPPTVTTVEGPSIISEPSVFTVTFSESVNGFTISDFGFSGSAAPALTSGTDGGSVYEVTLTPACGCTRDRDDNHRGRGCNR